LVEYLTASSFQVPASRSGVRFRLPASGFPLPASGFPLPVSGFPLPAAQVSELNSASDSWKLEAGSLKLEAVTAVFAPSAAAG
jgi:hypothetical protein